jgi:hypothetical protein
MSRLSVVFALLVACSLLASASSLVTLPERWKEVGFEPKEFFGQIYVIEIRHGQLMFNDVFISEEEILDAAQKSAEMVPAVPLYIRLSTKDYVRLFTLAKRIGDRKGCSGRPCLFKVEGRNYPEPHLEVVP